jgi:hypothetical protein
MPPLEVIGPTPREIWPDAASPGHAAQAPELAQCRDANAAKVHGALSRDG